MTGHTVHIISLPNTVCRLPDRYIDGIVETVWTPGVGCGAFPFGMDCNHDTSTEFELQPRDKYGWLFLWTMRLIEGWVHTRCKNFELPFGDQVRDARKRFHYITSASSLMYLPSLEDCDLATCHPIKLHFFNLKFKRPCESRARGQKAPKEEFHATSYN